MQVEREVGQREGVSGVGFEVVGDCAGEARVADVAPRADDIAGDLDGEFRHADGLSRCAFACKQCAGRSEGKAQRLFQYEFLQTHY